MPSALELADPIDAVGPPVVTVEIEADEVPPPSERHEAVWLDATLADTVGSRHGT